MKLTKYEHACFTVEKEGKLLVVDPGVFTTDLPALDSVVAIVITHEHPDHFDMTALSALVARNPDAMIYAHSDITRTIANALPNTAADAGEVVKAGPFKLEFFGGTHAVIHPDMPVVANLGVMVNGSLYYPGDSFTLPNRTVDTLALPVAAPWLKMSEAFDFLIAVKPRLVFPTHDAIASDTGKGLADRMTPPFADKVGASYQRIDQPIEIDG